VPRGLSRKVKIRAEEVAKLLRARGCATVRAVMGLGFSNTQADHALKHLAAAGRAVCVYVGDVGMWCYSRRSAVKHLRRLRHLLHGLICAAKLKYVTPKKALMLISGDKAAKRVFGRYISLNLDAGSLQFVNGLLKLTYGEPAVRRRRKPVYFADCGKKPKPLPPGIYGRKEYATVHFKAEPALKEALLKAAAAEGVLVSELVRRAVERLLAQYKASELKNTRKQHTHAQTRKKKD
jgi:hypothetical protein